MSLPDDSQSQSLQSAAQKIQEEVEKDPRSVAANTALSLQAKMLYQTVLTTARSSIALRISC